MNLAQFIGLAVSPSVKVRIVSLLFFYFLHNIRVQTKEVMKAFFWENFLLCLEWGNKCSIFWSKHLKIYLNLFIRFSIISSFDWKKIEDSVEDGLIITAINTGIFFVLKAAKVKLPKASLDAMDIMNLFGEYEEGISKRLCSLLCRVSCWGVMLSLQAII